MARLVDRIISFLSNKKTTAPEKINVQHSLLEQLPAELILLVCSYMSNIDIACLALCCHVLLLKIGKDSLLLADRNGKNREQLLTRISQDIPSYYYCHFCSMIHPWANINMPSLQRRQKYTSCIESDFLWPYMNTNKRVTSFYHFKFVHLQLTMRAYRYGLGYGISADSLSHVEVLRPAHGPAVTTLMSVESRICLKQDNPNDTSLLLRIQQWAKMPSFCPDIATLADMVGMNICVHIYFQKFVHSLGAEEGKSGAAQNVTHQCHRCLVQFQYQLQDTLTQTDRKAQVLIVTKWLDLGGGLTPQDPLWRAHKDPFPKPQPPCQDVGSVRRRFESEPGPSQQNLTVRNGLLMSRERFRQELCRANSDVWVGRPEQ